MPKSGPVTVSPSSSPVRLKDASSIGAAPPGDTSFRNAVCSVWRA